MNSRLRKAMKSRAVKVWNTSRSIAQVAGACGCSEREARVFLSTQMGYPGEISIRKTKMKLVEVQTERPDIPITLFHVSFLDPERRLPGERV